MLKHVCEYIPGFDERFYINEFGDVYLKLRKEFLGNGTCTWRSTGVSYSPLIRQHLYINKKYDELTPKGYQHRKYVSKDIKIYDCGEIERIVGRGREVLYYKKDNVYLSFWKKKSQKRDYKSLDTQPHRYTIHTIVYRLFIGDIKEGNIVHHKDFNKSNNWYRNLVQLTKAEHGYLHRIEQLK